MSGTSVGIAVNDVLDCSEVVLEKAALTDLGRDLDRRNGDEKRRRLFGSTLLAVVQERGTGVAFAVDTNASSECAESYIT